MKTLVTGAAGFIGSHLCEHLLNAGHQVYAVDNLIAGRRLNMVDFITHPKFTFHEVDVNNTPELTRLMEGVDWVFHLAGLADIVPSIEQPHLYYHNNVTGTFSVLEAARANGVKRFLYAASASCYGLPDVFPTPEETPINAEYPYAMTKRLGEELVLHWGHVYNMPVLSLRLFNVYGPRSRTTGAYGAVFGVFLAQKLASKPYTVVGDGEQTRDFTFVSDVARAFMAAAESEHTGEFMNVGSGGTYSINTLVKLLGGEITYIPKRPGEPDCTFADINKITSLLDWKPEVSFEEGVGVMLEHIEDWKDAPVWDPKAIAEATQSWFKYLGES